MQGWLKKDAAAKYAGISKRTFHKWLEDGLRHVRLPSSTILIKYEWIDKFLENFEVVENEVDEITEQICEEIL